MAKFTKAETDWVAELQAVLDRCPSKRLGFYTIGDCTVEVYDRSKEVKIHDDMDKHGDFFCSAVDRLGARFGDIKFPYNVHATSG